MTVSAIQQSCHLTPVFAQLDGYFHRDSLRHRPLKPGDIVIDRYMKVARAIRLTIGRQGKVDEVYARID